MNFSDIIIVFKLDILSETVEIDKPFFVSTFIIGYKENAQIDLFITDFLKWILNLQMVYALSTTFRKSSGWERHFSLLIKMSAIPFTI